MLSYNRIKTNVEYDGYDDNNLLDPNDSFSHAKSDQKNLAVDYSLHKEYYHLDLRASTGDYKRDAYDSAVAAYRAKIKEYSILNTFEYGSNRTVLGLEYKDIDGMYTYDSPVITSYSIHYTKLYECQL